MFPHEKMDSVYQRYKHVYEAYDDETIVGTLQSPQDAEYYAEAYGPVGLSAAYISRAESYQEAILARCSLHPRQVILRFVENGSEVDQSTSSELVLCAVAIGRYLSRKYGLVKGDRVALCFAPGLDFFRAFVSCVLYGLFFLGYVRFVAVPICPINPNDIERTSQSFLQLVFMSKSKVILTNRYYQNRLKLKIGVMRISHAFRLQSGFLPELENLDVPWDTVDSMWNPKEVQGRILDPADISTTPVQKGDVMLVQYSSGSTSAPKGVLVTHRNVLKNFLPQFLQPHVTLSWLPHYHDLCLQSSLFAITCCRSLVLASASEFVSKPESWLHMLSKYRATATAAPNFAYEIVAKKLSAKQQIKLDLSSVRLSLNGAEPLRWGTIEKYQSTFARFGWRATAMCPVYGLAESTLIVTGAQPEECVKWIDIDRAEYAKGFIKVMRKGEVRIQTGEEFTKTTDQGNALRLVACGSPVDCEVAIVCPEERVVLRQGRIGEIWVRGDRVCVGYDNDEEATNATFRGVLVEISISNSTEEKARECKAQEYEAHEYEAQEYEAQEYEAQEYWLRTGDLGFFHDGLLFISSRLKDVIIINGVNIFPSDIEQAVEGAHPHMRPGRCIAATIETGGHDRLAIFVEVRDHQLDHIDHNSVCRTISQTARRACAVAPTLVASFSARSFPLTTSGKLKRLATAHSYLTKALSPLYEHCTAHHQDRVWNRAECVQALTLASPPQLTERAICCILYLWLMDQLDLEPTGIDGLSNVSLVSTGMNSSSLTELHQFLRSAFPAVDTTPALIDESTSISTLSGLIFDHVSKEDRHIPFAQPLLLQDFLTCTQVTDFLFRLHLLPPDSTSHEWASYFTLPLSHPHVLPRSLPLQGSANLAESELWPPLFDSFLHMFGISPTHELFLCFDDLTFANISSELANQILLRLRCDNAVTVPSTKNLKQDQRIEMLVGSVQDKNDNSGICIDNSETLSHQKAARSLKSTPNATLTARNSIKIASIAPDRFRSKPLAIIGIALRGPRSINNSDSFWRDLTGEGPHAPCSARNNRIEYSNEKRRTEAQSNCDSGKEAESNGKETGSGRAVGDKLSLCETLAREALGQCSLEPVLTGIFYGGSERFSGQIAKSLGVKGPTVDIDTACTSSISAMQSAASYLSENGRQRGTYAIVLSACFGETEDASKLATDALHSMGILSQQGQAMPFGLGRDGTWPCEFGGAVGLLPLDDAIALKQPAWAVLRGAHVMQAPINALGLQKPSDHATVARASHDCAGVRSQEVEYVECHALGTPLGDRIELEALTDIYGSELFPRDPVLLGTHTASYGHCFHASGMLAFIKVAIMLARGGPCPPQNTFLIDPSLEKVAVGMHILGSKRATQAEQPYSMQALETRRMMRVACLHSYGSDGTVAHATLTYAPAGLAHHFAAREAEDPSAGHSQRSPPLVDSTMSNTSELHDSMNFKLGTASTKALLPLNPDCLQTILQDYSLMPTTNDRVTHLMMVVLGLSHCSAHEDTALLLPFWQCERICEDIADAIVGALRHGGVVPRPPNHLRHGCTVRDLALHLEQEFQNSVRVCELVMLYKHMHQYSPMTPSTSPRTATPSNLSKQSHKIIPIVQRADALRDDQIHSDFPTYVLSVVEEITGGVVRQSDTLKSLGLTSAQCFELIQQFQGIGSSSIALDARHLDMSMDELAADMLLQTYMSWRK